MKIKARLLISSSCPLPKDELGWRYFLPNMTSKTFNFTHSEMFRDKKNQKIILENLLNFIDEITEEEVTPF